MANIKSFWIIVILFLSTRFILVKPSVEACNRTENVFICDEDATQCISAHHLCNGIPECPNGRDEAVSQCGCLPNEFRCSNSCVALVKRCDRNVDCEMGEDEEDCKTFICPKTHFKCNNHFCVPLHAVCDFKDDCGDQSDELNCLRRPCWNPEFRCDNGECLRPGQLCDGTIDCADGSDEKYCNVEDFVECGDGSYMNKYYWCDDWPDCPLNHADEINCRNCSLEEFQCPNGRCIRQANVCDSQCDCALTNKSANSEICADEINCHLYYSMQNGITVCEPGESLGCSVPTGSVRERCIKFKYLCDGYNDCHNGNFLSDEFGCGGRNDFPESTFVCQDNRTLPSSLKCDYKADCLHGDDEFNCTENNCTKHEFQCNNGQCVQYNARCDLKLDCLDKSDELDCDEFTCKFGFRKCINSGQCVRADYWCDYFVDCPDGSDERNCNFTTFDCIEGQFRCNSGQCISGNLQCFNSGEYRTGCADKSHLTHCKDWTCLEDQFKCSLGPCLNLSLLCNSQVDCSDYWEDEENCTFACSNTTPQCDCKDVHINCTGRGVIQVPQDVEKEITWFYLGSNNLNGSLTNETFLHLDRLLYLDLSNNSISTLPALLFVNLWRLSVLDLHDNKLTLLTNGSFIGLGSLKVLHLQGNKLHVLQSHAFYGLLSLKTLDLHGQKLHAIEPGAFVGLRSLNGLDLSSNEITYLDHGSLLGMPQLLFLYLRNNKIELIEENVFRSTPSLYRLETDEFRFCCLARHTTLCLPHPDEFSSCEDLLSNLVLRLCVWLLAGVATVGNILVIIWRSRYSHCNQVHSFLITNLALGDLLMGSYLLVIALVDCHYRGVYFIHDSAWRSSSLCAIAGFLSTFSSELSVFTLTVITLDRFLVIIFPFRVRRMEMARTRRLMALGWVIAAIVSAVPLLNIQYFQNFYGRSGVCLALHITPDQPNGWEYSVIIFLFLNLVSFSIIAASYLWMFFAARTTQLAVKKDRRSTESAMAWRMSLLVATDAACWVPIITLGLASLAGFTVPPQVFAWVAVFVLPLNAALNPVLYTLSTAPFLNPARHSLLTFRQSWKLSRYNSSISGTTTHRYGRSRSNLSTCYSITNRSSIRWQQRVETASEVRESIPISSITT